MTQQTTETSFRSPLDNPQAGDRVRGKSGRVRRVVRRQGGDIWYVTEGQANAHEKGCWISTWMSWARETVEIGAVSS